MTVAEQVDLLIRAIEGGALADVCERYWNVEAPTNEGDLALAREGLAIADAILGEPAAGAALDDAVSRVSGRRDLLGLGLLIRASILRSPPRSAS